ncbi:branched-chain amino acid transport system substrate-binding protein [Rhodoplanes tepidamans]|nr:branched-chain amino acid transport system substrate-binding protein [Rhodoplanes tepidamans]
MRRRVVLLFLCMLLAAPVGARAEPPIRIGDISSYSALPIGTRGYRQGWELARDQINGRGGVLGRRMEIVARDDAGKPADAITQAVQLVESERVDLLTGGILSHVGLALADFANQKKIYFLASQPLTDALILEKGNRYTFRLRPSTFTQTAILAREAAKLPAKRWATIAPNYEFGQSAVASFRAEMRRLRPDVEFVDAQWPPLGKIDAGATVLAMMAAQPDAVFNATFGPDLVKLVREANTRHAFEGRSVVSLMTGEPEYLAPLKDEVPAGWLVTGYPWDTIRSPEHDAFLTAYRERFKEPPTIGALIGYINTLVLAAAIEKAGSTRTDDLIRATEGLRIESTPVGPISFRALDHQSTLGVYLGRLALKDGRGVMVDWRYVDGKDFQAPDNVVAARRPQ